ncbi:uncharacterized protein [Lolium perenne]|uniref:uncharacterized protein isoform X1 n=1 Tax=Lolium perenne TaxID=4522 RepID=UPI0021F67D9E|nr:uncharacterized protein LOC127333515 isoform X5 [Lolium perenne]XP_051215849.1 uncharacterized protein LOC127333515 isoform X6 [Lolium perenne]XP_051215850.1 uncharacterized protein LOC127333515 isoform X7 [Lolium perenne]XP_051215851.1 uncharacterized protein LOC127333515 isoform X8 [Lolium perenne]
MAFIPELRLVYLKGRRASFRTSSEQQRDLVGGRHYLPIGTISCSTSSSSRADLLVLLHLGLSPLPASFFVARSAAGRHLLLSICFFPDRIAKWCGEIRQVLRMSLGKF